ncbi:MAG: hypothetical protein HKN48_11360 [Flavobacteriaceae bacterium]|nr:hypothetical protein [Flavobacteriaceae bacterium]
MVIAFSPIGLFMGCLMIMGSQIPWVIIIWATFSFMVAYVIAKYEKQKLLFHAILIGIIWGILHNIVAAIFSELFLLNYPNLINVSSRPESISLGYWLFVTGPIVGFCLGILITMFVYFLKVVNEKKWSIRH